MFARSIFRVMVIHDDSLMLKLLSELLTNLGGTQVTTCDRGRSAIESIDNSDSPPNLGQISCAEVNIRCGAGACCY